MKTTSLTTTAFSHSAVEVYITNLDMELSDFDKMQGKEDALKDHELTESLFNIKVREFVCSKIQAAIDYIRNTLLVTSVIFDAAEIDRNVQKKTQIISNEINDRLQVQASLKRKLACIILDPLKRKYGKWLMIIALCVGIGDAAIAFGSFRNGAFTFFQAFIASLAIGAAISVSHLFYTQWIKRATTAAKRTTRITIVLLTAFVFFAWIGNLRAETASNTVDIALDGTNVSAVDSSHLNGWAIAIISFILFSVVLFLALVLWKSKEERLKEQEYDKLHGEISAIDAEIKTLEEEKADIESLSLIQKREARQTFDYAINSIRRCKSIGISAITTYKQTYARFHNDIVPTFFANACDFTYDESFHFPKPPKSESV